MQQTNSDVSEESHTEPHHHLKERGSALACHQAWQVLFLTMVERADQPAQSIGFAGTWQRARYTLTTYNQICNSTYLT